MERDLGTQWGKVGEGLECAKSFVRREGRGDAMEERNPFPGEAGVELVERAVWHCWCPLAPPGTVPLLPTSLSLQNQSIWGGVTMATWVPYPKTSEKVIGCIWKNGDQKP